MKAYKHPTQLNMPTAMFKRIKHQVMNGKMDPLSTNHRIRMTKSRHRRGARGVHQHRAILGAAPRPPGERRAANPRHDRWASQKRPVTVSFDSETDNMYLPPKERATRAARAAPRDILIYWTSWQRVQRFAQNHQFFKALRILRWYPRASSHAHCRNS